MAEFPKGYGTLGGHWSTPTPVAKPRATEMQIEPVAPPVPPPPTTMDEAPLPIEAAAPVPSHEPKHSTPPTTQKAKPHHQPKHHGRL